MLQIQHTTRSVPYISIFSLYFRSIFSIPKRFLHIEAPYSRPVTGGKVTHALPSFLSVASLSSLSSFDRMSRISPPLLPGHIVEGKLAVASQIQGKECEV